MGNDIRGNKNPYKRENRENNLINFDYEELKRYSRNKKNRTQSNNLNYDYSRYLKNDEDSKYKKRRTERENYKTENKNSYDNDLDYTTLPRYNKEIKRQRYKDENENRYNTRSRRDLNDSKKNNGKKHKRKKRKGCIGLIVLIVSIGLFVTSSTFVYKFAKNISGGVVNDFKEKNIPQEEIKVSIAEGSSTKDIAKILKNSGLIKSTFSFNIKCKIDKIDGTLNYGEYTFNTYMDFYEITKILQSNSQGEKDYITFTVNEGLTMKQIAEKLEKENIVKAEEFISACNNNKYNYDFIKQIPERENRLEGYLFPDTYFFSLNADSDEIINKMLSKFNTVYSDEFVKKTKERKMTIDDVVKVASIIEKEIKYPDERNIAASVIYNRIKNSMKLQMDSTVLYAIGENKNRVMEEDTKVQSDYNTYYVTGLPKGPISSPGEACIKAALYPAETDYLYYVVQDDNTGQHFFTNSYDEFVEAKKNYVSKFQ